jgi:CheY-specific phosphatase CheX
VEKAKALYDFMLTSVSNYREFDKAVELTVQDLTNIITQRH